MTVSTMRMPAAMDASGPLTLLHSCLAATLVDCVATSCLIGLSARLKAASAQDPKEDIWLQPRLNHVIRHRMLRSVVACVGYWVL